MNDIKIIVNRIPEYAEECPFVYDKIEEAHPTWCRGGYNVPVDYCGFTNERCKLYEKGCKHLLSIDQILKKG